MTDLGYSRSDALYAARMLHSMTPQELTRFAEWMARYIEGKQVNVAAVGKQ